MSTCKNYRLHPRFILVFTLAARAQAENQPGFWFRFNWHIPCCVKTTTHMGAYFFTLSRRFKREDQNITAGTFRRAVVRR